MLIALLAVGIVGILGMTWLFPLAASLQCALQKVFLNNASQRLAAGERKSSEPCRSGSIASECTSSHVGSVDILIPAHNEELALPATLESIFKSTERLHEHCRVSGLMPVKVSVTVGIDGSTDRTKEIAQRFPVTVMESSTNLGKWNNLQSLASTSTADWVVFADCGVLWQEDLLVKALPLCADASVAAVAPTYHNPDGGIVERTLWAIERHLKTLEGVAGGPVTMHGATVIYRRSLLIQAFSALGSRGWLNDDVVIPLCIRTLNPDVTVRYEPSLAVHEQPMSKAQRKKHREFSRRRRMVAGNAEWMSALLPRTWRSAPLVGLIALRRVFRLFWAYWGLALGAAAFIALTSLLPASASIVLAGTSLAILVFAYQASSGVRALLEAATASIAAPYYLYLGFLSSKFGNNGSISGTVWK